MVEAKKPKKTKKKKTKKGEEKIWNLVNSDRMHDLIMSEDGRGGCVGCCLDA